MGWGECQQSWLHHEEPSSDDYSRPLPTAPPSGHPGVWEGFFPLLSSPPTLLCFPLQAFQAALQTQWSWLLQLCCCIEAHLKENSSYFQVVLQEGRGRVHSL